MSFILFSVDMSSYVYASSRGKGLKDIENAVLYTKPGGKYLDLLNIAKSYLQYSDGRQFVYFMCGIPDICKLERDKTSNYEESFFDLDKSIDQVFDDIVGKIRQVSEGLNNIGYKVVFCTICTMNIEKWNHSRLNQGKTSFLKYEDKYVVMQEQLNCLLCRLNQFITELNVSNGLCTPFLHSYVHQKCAGSKIRYKYSKLVDGVHPSPELNNQWLIHLQKVIYDHEQKFL